MAPVSSSPWTIEKTVTEIIVFYGLNKHPGSTLIFEKGVP